MKMLERKIHFVVLAVLLAVSLGTGTLYFHYAEGWSIIDSFYFSTMTLTTIGYGDLAPTSEGTKLFTSFYAIFGIGIMLYIVRSVIGSFFVKEGEYFERVFTSRRSATKKLKK